MIDAGKVSPQVAFQAHRKPPGELRRTAHTRMGSLPGAAGEAVLNKPGLKKRRQHPHQRMVNHPVAEWCRRHHPFFRFKDFENTDYRIILL